MVAIMTTDILRTKSSKALFTISNRLPPDLLAKQEAINPAMRLTMGI